MLHIIVVIVLVGLDFACNFSTYESTVLICFKIACFVFCINHRALCKVVVCSLNWKSFTVICSNLWTVHVNVDCNDSLNLISVLFELCFTCLLWHWIDFVVFQLSFTVRRLVFRCQDVFTTFSHWTLWHLQMAKMFQM